MSTAKADYGIDAPNVLRNLFVFGALCWALAFLTPARVHVGKNVFLFRQPLLWTGGFLLLEGLLFLLYVKVGKFGHRDRMLEWAALKGTERVLDVGCGRGLLLAGAAKRLPLGSATGIDVWSNLDMGGNSLEATERNLEIEGISERCNLLSVGAQAMPFGDAAFDVVLSNLCLHNIYDKATRTKALDEIARVLRPGGVALLSDYKHVGEYARILRGHGMAVEVRWGNPLLTFPPLRVAVARKPAA